MVVLLCNVKGWLSLLYLSLLYSGINKATMKTRVISRQHGTSNNLNYYLSTYNVISATKIVSFRITLAIFMPKGWVKIMFTTRRVQNNAYNVIDKGCKHHEVYKVKTRG